MKRILLAICLVFLFSTFSFAEDVVILPSMTKPASGGIDTYVLTNNDGSTKVVNVIDFGNGSYVSVDNDGSPTHIMKIGD
jgi:hypothetical protein